MHRIEDEWCCPFLHGIQRPPVENAVIALRFSTLFSSFSLYVQFCEELKGMLPLCLHAVNPL